MMRLAERLWPINRSLTGEGVRETLSLLKERLPDLRILSVPSGYKAFDWTVPQEWQVSEAYIVTPNGDRICDFAQNNLHLMGYSISINARVSLAELQSHLYSLKLQPDAIPYVTSYYSRNWGFCLTQRQRDSLEPGDYHVVIRSQLFDGILNYGEVVIPGETDREVFFSTYVCHPSMANNELSGPVLATQLAQWVSSFQNYYSYRFIFVPETIGSLVYLSKNLEAMKRKVLAGYVLTCVGDGRAYSYVPSRSGDSVADRIALTVLQDSQIDFERYSWLDRGSDERQYCAPGVDLPVCSVMRSKYGEYPEYHTSLDSLGQVVTADGLEGSFEVYRKIISLIETQRFPASCNVGEPQLSKRGLYPNISMKGNYDDVKVLVDFLSLCDGKTSLSEISTALRIDEEAVPQLLTTLIRNGLVEI